MASLYHHCKGVPADNGSEIKLNELDNPKFKIEKTNFVWNLPNYLQECNTQIHSPLFYTKPEYEENWSISFYPVGPCIGEGYKYSGISLHRSRNCKFSGQFKLSLIENIYNKTLATVSSKFEANEFWKDRDYLEFFEQTKILSHIGARLISKNLSIKCEFILYVDGDDDNNAELGQENEKSLQQQQHQQITKLNPKMNILEKLFLEEQLSDVKLIASCGQSLPAHKTILAASSPVFQAMFKIEMKEQIQGEVKIDDGDYKTVKEMLRFIYLGEIDNIELIAFDLLVLAHRYELVVLTDYCGEVLKQQITTDNVIKIIEIADLYKIDDLKIHAINFVKSYVKDAVNSGKFESSISLDLLKNIFTELHSKVL